MFKPRIIPATEVSRETAEHESAKEIIAHSGVSDRR
jgi:hypothetical protein